MFEAAEVDHEISKDEFKQQLEPLITELMKAQRAMLDAKRQGVVVVIAGVDAAGKSETVQMINTWLDPRHVRTLAFGEPTDEERERPLLWRYWRMLPPRGSIGIFFDSWYDYGLHGRAYGDLSLAELDREVEGARRFERMLTEEGFVVLKLWFHLSKADQRRRLRALEKDKRTRWRVTHEDWDHYSKYERMLAAAGRALRNSSTEYAPWIVVPGKDPRYRGITVGRALLDALSNEDVEAQPSETMLHPVAAIDDHNVLRALDLTQKLERDEYERELDELQRRLALAMRRRKFKKRSLVIVFEGMDAAGKGGAIRRAVAGLDPRRYHVVPIAAPSDEERARPYLWRFWRHVPRNGRAAVFDRSWYGRVLVERVEGYCTTNDWMRAYSEINDFEEQLVEEGNVLVKLWLHIDLEEQLQRFRDREREPNKQHKIGPDDWRNREKWPKYEQAIIDMIDRTSTEIAPWTLVEANDKYHARVKVLRTICDRLEAALED
ncbi:MAG TPA: polyphosphate:AMP phosphotransferase [Nannocystaceae bacterium]|nr:polyphosphate:AMP phosphotransferase [Nannocystaceae bacterium]